jgi:protein-tyrosine-phosphatase
MLKLVGEAFLKKFRPGIQFDSAGTNLVLLRISEGDRKLLKIENVSNLLKEESEGLEEKKLGEYYQIVAMKPRHKEIVSRICPSCEDKIVVWNISDPYFLPEHLTKIF